LPRSRRDSTRWWPSWIDAYGCLRSGEHIHHFFVAWDTDGAPEAHRRARVRAWYDALAPGTWGEDGLPPILLLCANAGREREWVAAVERLAHRRGVSPP